MRVLCVAAHPDDEVLGCGGTLARHVDEKDVVSVLVVTDGVRSRYVDGNGFKEAKSLDAALTARHDECEAACVELRVERLRRLDNGLTFPDQGLDTVPLRLLAARIAAVVVAERPDVVYTHWHGDANQDHRAVAQAVLIATRPLKDDTVGLMRLLAFEVPESTAIGSPAFSPTVFVSLTHDQVCRKLAALACYESERRSWPHPRSETAVEAFVRARGSESRAGYAEAFVLLREVR